MNKLIFKVLILIKWKKKIFPVIIKDYFSKNILMLAWINRYCLIENYYNKKTCYWSRSNKKIWRKGFSSGNIQIILKFKFDCDCDSFIFKIIKFKNVCHYKIDNCFNYFL